MVNFKNFKNRINRLSGEFDNENEVSLKNTCKSYTNQSLVLPLAQLMYIHGVVVPAQTQIFFDGKSKINPPVHKA